MKTDYHLHTAYSDDSIYPLEDLVKDAIQLGLKEICVTDHVDYGVKYDRDDPNRPKDAVLNVDYPAYFDELEKLQQVYGSQITIKKGLEFGVQLHTVDAFERLFETYPLDFVLLSIHQIDDLEFWTQDFQKGRSQKEYNEHYYSYLYDVISRFPHYSVLSHLDLIVRYDKQGRYPFEQVKPLLEKILKKAIADGKGIEVNTSSFQYGLDDLTPSRDILRLYHELGGTIVTIGSDAHTKQYVGNRIEDVKRELKEMGFTHFHTFEAMKPIAHEL